MKILIIYDSKIRNYVEDLRRRINEEFGADTILRIKSFYSFDVKNELFGKTKLWQKCAKRLIKYTWHFDAKKMMKLADIIVYVASEQSSNNKHVDWELKKALKYGKSIICLNDREYDLNDCLWRWDSRTKRKTWLADKMLENEDDLFQILKDHNNGNELGLFNNDNPDVLMEQYKLFIQTAENLLERRQNTNNFYVGVNSVIWTICAGIVTSDKLGAGFKLPVVFALALLGIFICNSWNGSLEANRINNKAKIKLLSMIEQKLPTSLYDAEWRVMKNKYSNEKYVSFTENEKKLTKVFFWMYIVISIIVALLIILHCFRVEIPS